MTYINPLTFFDSSSIINYGNVNNQDKNTTQQDAKNQFLAMLIEKIYLRDFKMTYSVEPEQNENGQDRESNIFSNETGDMIVNDIFKKQLAQQMIDSNLLDFNTEGIK